jgi:TolA-binding protein
MMKRATLSSGNWMALPVIGVFLLTASCHKNTVRPASRPTTSQPAHASPAPGSVPTTSPELPPPPSSLPTPPAPPPPPKDFRDGEAYFQSGKYADAARSYNRYIQDDLIAQFKDAATFKMGLALALACTSSDCRARSQDQFKLLLSHYPESPYSPEARFILSLQGDIDKLKADTKSRDDKIKKLTDELERLKKIDLERKATPVKK